MTKEIYTHSEAARIIALFEDILIQNDIAVPSPEDDERDKDDRIGLYGSTYSDLLDAVEERLINLTKIAKEGAEIIPDIFNDFVEIDWEKDKQDEMYMEAMDVLQEMRERDERWDGEEYLD